MNIDKKAILDRLGQCDFSGLFTQELGWEFPPGNQVITLDGYDYYLTAVAEKRGMVVYACSPDAAGKISPPAMRKKIASETRKLMHENMLIYTNANGDTQIYQWIDRSRKPVRPVEFAIYPGHSGEALAQRLMELAFTLDEEEGLTLPDVTNRFRKNLSVERVTKGFYERFKKEHSVFLTFIDGISAQGDREWYASIMLNRLMFLYFIQKKGFLDNDLGYLRNRLQMVQKTHGNDHFLSFYRYFLKRLMHEGLNLKVENRVPDLDTLIGDVPYLNGGIFEEHTLELAYQGIDIPDEAFESIFDFFDEYQWHLDDRPLHNDREINPDVLGYIFEKYINQKQMGAYYTKEDITEYIGKNTILPFIFDAAQKQCGVAFAPDAVLWQRLKRDPDRYLYDAVREGVIDEDGAVIPLPADIEAGIADVAQREGWNKAADAPYALPTETWREHVARRQSCLDLREKLQRGEVQTIHDFITLNLDIVQFAQDAISEREDPDLLRAFYRAVSSVTVLDPTCGSGAFLFAALNLLEPLYDGCLLRMQHFVDDLDRSDEKHSPKKFSDFREVLQQADDHTNRSYFIYKTIILNNLFGVDMMAEATEICKLRLFLKLVAQVENVTHLEPLPDIDFNIRAGNTLVGFATFDDVKRTLETDLVKQLELPKIQERAEIAARAFRQFREQQIKHKGDVTPADKDNLRKRLGELETELNRYLSTEYGINPDKQQKKYEDWLASHQPFHWFVDFYAIMQAGGFDVIIGNPPYVEYRKVISSYKIKNYKSDEVKNLYGFCMERSCQLINKKGCFGMIIPSGLLGLDDAASLRSILLENYSMIFVSTYSIRPSKLFDGVDQRLCIMLAIKGDFEALYSTRYHHWSSEERPFLFNNIQYTKSFSHPAFNRIPQLYNHLAHSIINKLETKRKSEIRSFYSNARTGFLAHYHRSPRYWIRAMDFEQYFKSPTRTRSIHHFRDITFTSQEEGKCVAAILNSTLFFMWFIVLGNGRNLTSTDVELFPVGEISGQTKILLIPLFDKLMDDYKANSFIRERKDCEYQEFRPALSKPIIDEIDRVLAAHYGFTDEELDFIINYDIKYRMGIDSDE